MSSPSLSPAVALTPYQKTINSIISSPKKMNELRNLFGIGNDPKLPSVKSEILSNKFYFDTDYFSNDDLRIFTIDLKKFLLKKSHNGPLKQKIISTQFAILYPSTLSSYVYENKKCHIFSVAVSLNNFIDSAVGNLDIIAARDQEDEIFYYIIDNKLRVDIKDNNFFYKLKEKQVIERTLHQMLRGKNAFYTIESAIRNYLKKDLQNSNKIIFLHNEARLNIFVSKEMNIDLSSLFDDSICSYDICYSGRSGYIVDRGSVTNFVIKADECPDFVGLIFLKDVNKNKQVRFLTP